MNGRTVLNHDANFQYNYELTFHFSLSGCGHCKKMKPEYIQVAADMKEEGVRFISILKNINIRNWSEEQVDDFSLTLKLVLHQIIRGFRELYPQISFL